MMNYYFLGDFDGAVHASDLLPTFCNNDTPVSELLQNCLNVRQRAVEVGQYMKGTFAPNYQSYLKSHAIYGNPNEGAKGRAKEIPWQPSITYKDDNHDHVRNVLQPHFPTRLGGNPFEITDKDPNNTATSCEFWNEVAPEVMMVVGSHQPEPLLTIQDDEESSPEL